MDQVETNSLNKFWLEDFTREHVTDYADAALKMLDYFQVLFAEGYESVVVPSRGSWPLITAALKAMYIKQQSISDRSKALQSKLEILKSPLHGATILPFSADPRTDSQTSAAIRKFWSHVLDALVKKNGTSPYLITYKMIVETLAKGSWFDTVGRDLPTEKFIFVDTVVSGRAICEIIAAFNELGLTQCHFLLIVDTSAQIDREYARIIEELEAVNRCTRVPIKKLFTEDRGPAVSGIWSMVYPQVMTKLQKTYPWAAQAYGAGSFYHKVSSSQEAPEAGEGNPEYNMPVTLMYGALKTAISAVIQQRITAEEFSNNVRNLTRSEVDPTKLEESQKKSLQKLNWGLDFMLHHAQADEQNFDKLSPLSKHTTRQLALPRVLQHQPDAQIEVSSSHLIRVNLPDEIVNTFFLKLDLAIQGAEDVLANDWFRKTPWGVSSS